MKWIFAIGALAMTTTAESGCKRGSEAAQCPTCVVANDRGFVPSKVTIPLGAPGTKTQITFTRTSDETCARDVVFPELNVKVPLPLNKPVSVPVPADVSKTYTFQCGMAMYKSSIVVE